MDRDVLIHINGIQYTGGDEPEPVEVITPGQYYYRNGNHYLTFEDITDNPNERTSSIMKFRPAYLEVKKKGFVDTRMVFEENKKTLTLYETPFGVMNVSVSATSIRLKEEKESIELIAEYALDINNSYMADCSITLTARSKKQGLELSS